MKLPVSSVTATIRAAGGSLWNTLKWSLRIQRPCKTTDKIPPDQSHEANPLILHKTGISVVDAAKSNQQNNWVIGRKPAENAYHRSGMHMASRWHCMREI
jgi:hypothetical protein